MPGLRKGLGRMAGTETVSREEGPAPKIGRRPGARNRNRRSACAPALGAALLGALLFFPAGGAAQEAVPIDITVGAAREVLSGDRDAWEEYWVRATYRPGPGTHLYGGVRWTRRFGEDDQQFEAGGGVPLLSGSPDFRRGPRSPGRARARSGPGSG